MLIQALCDYYDVLAAQRKVLPEEYSSVRISYLVSLTPEGRIDGIIDWRNNETVLQKGKEKEVRKPRIVALPRRTEKPGIDGNIVEHRPLYVFGLNYDSKTNTLNPDDKTGKARKSHEAFVKKNLDFFESLDDNVCVAFRNFLKVWKPEEETSNSELLAIGKELTTAGFAFCLSGRPDILLHECDAVKKHWEAEYSALTDTGNNEEAQCGIYGERLPIARIHDKIKNVPGGASTGNTLVCNNNTSEYSYGHDQSFNSNVSEQAMKHYTQAMNYLMADARHRTLLDDITILHWASTGDDDCDEIFNMLTFSDDLDADHTNDTIKRFLHGAKEGKILVDTADIEKDIDPNIIFYIVGIKPNSARLSVKFIYRQKFGIIVKNLLMHQQDLRIAKSSLQIPLWRIRKELLSPKSTNLKIDPSAMTKILGAVIYGYAYPDFLFRTIVQRIRIDSDDDNNSYIKMNDVRMGILKACINRSDRLRGQKEEIIMALDETNKNPAYLCGRLFAVLENIQKRALGYGLNRTIKDTYFASASARPAMVFPKLLTLAQHHMGKMNSDYGDKDIQSITRDLDGEFPHILSLKDQGIFMLGYYQQKDYIKQKIDESVEKKEELK